MCSSAQAAGGRQQEAQGSAWGMLEGKHQPRDLTHCVNTYLYKAEAALFSPLGLLGLGSPAMLMSARKGHAAVTRHIPEHLHLTWAPSWGGCTALPERNVLPHIPHTFPPASGTSGACWGSTGR